MEWLFGEKLPDKTWIEQFEVRSDYHYPEQFIQIVLEHDGASPKNNVYDTELIKGRVFEYLLSFNEEDDAPIWDYLGDEKEWDIDGLDWRYVPFAIDPFGNFICFDRTNDRVVFWNHETTEVEVVADDFSSFIDALYPFDEEEFFAKYMN